MSSFGIGGTNAHVVLEQAPAVDIPAEGAAAPYLIAVSAASAAALRATSARLAEALCEPGRRMADVAYTLAAGRRQLGWRRSVVGDGAQALSAQLASAVWEPVAAVDQPNPSSS